MSVPGVSAFWDRVDAACVINLDQRRDRWERLRQEAHGLIPDDKLRRVSAVLGRDLPGFGRPPWFRGRKRDTTWAGRAGCALSHRRALLMARDAGHRTVLVLEDDAALEASFANLLGPLQETLDRHPWDVCYLGFVDPLPPFRAIGPVGDGRSLYRIFGCNTTHAYMVNERARDWLIENLPEERAVWDWVSKNRALDRWYSYTLGCRFQVTCVSPSLVDQHSDFSDVVERYSPRNEADGHRRGVPGAMTSARSFGIRLRLACAFAAIRREYDRLRGWLKRLNGF